MEIAKIDSILSMFSETRGNLIAILHVIQNEFRYLPEEELRYLSKKVDIPMTQIYSIANFYNRFSLTPKGENEIHVCLGTACHVKGAPKILNEIKKKLNIGVGETTVDMKFSLEAVRCIGACSLAPAVVINENTYREVSSENIDEILTKYQ